MKRRVFVAVSTPESIKKEVLEWQKRYSHLNVRWIKPENLHITVIPPWYVTEDELDEVVKVLERTLKSFRPFPVRFEKILFGPSGQPPRLIWAEANCLASAGNLATRRQTWEREKFPRVSPRRRNEGETPPEFIILKEEIQNALLQNPTTGFREKETRPAKLHLTIARFRTGSIKKLPPLNGGVNWEFAIDRVDLMESKLKRTGAEYRILQKFAIT